MEAILIRPVDPDPAFLELKFKFEVIRYNACHLNTRASIMKGL